MFITKPKPRHAGFASLSALALMIALQGLFHVWVKVGRDEDRRQRIAAVELERLGGYVEYLDLKDKADPDFNRVYRGRFDWECKPPIMPRTVNGLGRWPVPWWSARRWTPAAYVGRDVPFTSRGTIWVGRRSIGAADDHDVAPMRVAVDIAFLASLVNDRVKHVLTDTEWDYFCRAFPSARSVAIRCPIKDEQLRFLKQMTNLNFLIFYNDGDELLGKGGFITGEGLTHLRSLPRLRNLCIDSVHLSEKGKEALGKLEELRCLILVNVTEEDAAFWQPDSYNDVLAHLAGLSRLEMLDVTNVTDAGLAHLRKLPSLHYLGLPSVAITDDGLRHLAGLALIELDVRFAAISDRGVVHLARLPNLQKLDLRGTKVTDAAIADLQKLKKLRSLDLSRTRFTDAGCRRLFDAMSTLERLGLPDGQHSLVREGGNVRERERDRSDMGAVRDTTKEPGSPTAPEPGTPSRP